MRTGGISTDFKYLIIKLLEDIKCFNYHNLSIIDVLKKTIFKTKQLLIKNKFVNSDFIKKIEKESKITLLRNPKDFILSNKKVMSALNLAYLAYNSKYKLRRHYTIFWPDGVFGKIVRNDIKVPGRVILKKFIKYLNKKPKLKVYMLGTLSHTSKEWLRRNLNINYMFVNLPNGNVDKIIRSIRNHKYENNSLLILIIPTPNKK